MIISVLSLMTTVTDWGVCPVRFCSKAMAACAICCAMVELDLIMLFVPSAPTCSIQAKKKADVAEHPEVFDHVGLLVNGPSSLAGVPFI